MSRYDALRDSDDEEEGEGDVPLMKPPTSNMSDYGSDQSDVEEIIIPSSSSLHPSRNPLEPPPQFGGMVVERIDKLTESLTATGTPTDSEIATCVKVLSFIGDNISLLKLQNLKPIRVALQPLLETLGEGTGNGGKGDLNGKKGKKRKNRSDDNDCLAEKERNYINQTQLKALRREKLEKLNEDGFNLRIPDGVALLPSSVSSSSSPMLLLDGSSSAAAGGDSSSELTLCSSTQQQQGLTFIHTLRNPLSCYICHKPYIQLHFFYHQLCPDCAIFNFNKREEMANMVGMVCIVTGGRTKIGYRTALKLLRCGATVIITTRFPVNAAETYAQEADSANWIKRLQIFGLDFRDISKLEAFCHFIELSYDRLDVLINNACQTVRRPPAYYSHLVEKEETYHAIATAETETGALKSLPYQAPEAEVASPGEGEDMEEVPRATRGGTGTGEATVATAVPMLLAKQNQFLSAYSSHQTALQLRDQQLIANSSASASSSGASSSATTASGASSESSAVASSTSASTSASAIASVAVSHISSAQMSQLTFLPEEKSDHLNPSTLQLLFPLGYKDVNNQQIDLRHHNSWTMKLDEISTVELAEVFAINSIAPTILNARLKPLMKRTKPIWLQAGIGISSEGLGRATGASAEGEEAREGWMMPWKFVVNVSAMEGKFYRYKSSNHPHTNMAKAALNMMTRTSAQDYRKDEIFMTAVDTGWINDEKPIERAMRHEEKHDFQTPLDEIDAASRVCDPVIGPLRAMEDWIQQQQQQQGKGKGKGGGERQELGKGERQQRKRGKGRDGIEGDATQVVPPKGMEPPWGHFIKDYMKSEW